MLGNECPALSPKVTIPLQALSEVAGDMLTFRQLFVDQAARVQGVTEGLCALRRASLAAYCIVRKHLGSNREVRFIRLHRSAKAMGCRSCT